MAKRKPSRPASGVGDQSHDVGLAAALAMPARDAGGLSFRERLAMHSLLVQIVGFVTHERFGLSTTDEAERQGISIETQLAVTAVRHADALIEALKEPEPCDRSK